MHAELTDREALLDEVVTSYFRAVGAGQSPDRQDLLTRYPDLAADLNDFFADQDKVRQLGAPLRSFASLASARGQMFGDFELEEEIGRGGMGVVYKARQKSLNRVVALKTLPFALDERQLQRFQNEARAAANLHHTNIVPVHSVGSERGVHFYAMQYIEGRNLASVIAGLAAERSPLPAEHFRTVARLGIQAAEALDYAHQTGIVHRDIKPANLLVDDTGRLWVTDFGLAQVQSDARLTTTGHAVGTLRYMSPEQALAQHGIVDHRADIYSLGATLYELLTLQPVFPGDDREVLRRQIMLDEPIRPHKLNKVIPAELETIVLKALEKNPRERYATAQELADDLRRHLEDKPISARRPSWRQVAGKWARRHRPLVRAVGLGLVVAVVALAVSTVWSLHKEKQADDARQYADGQRVAAEVNAAEADKQRRQVEENFREAVKLMNGLLDQSKQNLPNTPETAHARMALANEAMPFIQDLLKKGEDRTDPEGRLLTALVYEALGTVHLNRGELLKAAECYVRARDLCKQLAAELPAEPVYDNEWQRINQLRIKSLRPLTAAQAAADAGLHDVAAKAFRDVLKIDEIMRAEFEDSEHLLQKVWSQLRLADELRALGQLPEAEQTYSEALVSCALLAKVSAKEVLPVMAPALKARALACRGLLRAESGRLKEAEQDLREALNGVDGLKPEDQQIAIQLVLHDRARVRSALGNVLWAADRRAEATDLFRAAEREWRNTPETAARDNQLAWFLATCPDPQFRNTKEAVEFAQKAVKGIAEKDPWRVLGLIDHRAGDCQRTLGVALYRAGEWKGAAEALHKGMILRSHRESDSVIYDDSFIKFFQAMTSWQRGYKEEARRHYDWGLQCMVKNRPNDEELRRFREEAAQLLGVKDAPPADKKKAPRPKP